jgi:predicted amidohydrolase
MRWLPACAHDNGLFLVYSNGVGVDDEIRTGVLSLRKPMILAPYGRILAETRKAATIGSWLTSTPRCSRSAQATAGL